jgi:FMN phosphatase YigB (HAD superfamily)
VLFDLDDTLVPWQTVQHWQWAWRPLGPLISDRHARATMRRTVRAWDRRRWQGLTGAMTAADLTVYRQFLRETLAAIAGRSLPPGEAEAVIDRFLHPTNEIERFPDAGATLAALTQRGIPYAVVTPLPLDVASSILKRTGLQDAPIVLSAAEPEDHRLPLRGAFRQACERIGSTPATTVFVGDLYWSDVRAAERAGLHGVLVDRLQLWPEVSGDRIPTLSELVGLPIFRGDSTPVPGPTPATGPDG